jgi:hypothetical protein
MAWQLRGQMIETCSCNMFCPCWFLDPEVMVMDQGYCDSALAFRIAAGNSEGVEFGNLDVVVGIDFPGPTMFEGQATARLYIDQRANAEQQRELEAIFRGQRGGPMGMVASLVSTWLPSKAAGIQVKDEGDVITLTVGENGRIESKLVRDPEGKSFEMRGGGFISGFGMESVEMAKSASRWSDAELPRSFETKSGARGNFAWNG